MSKETLHIELGRRYRFFRVAPPAQFQIERQRKQPRLRQVQQSVWPWPQLHRGNSGVRENHRDTGMISNLADLDKFVNEKVIEPFDHRSLNEEVAEFRNTVPTTEILCIEIFKRLKTFPHAKLEAVRVVETSNNSFEYAGN